MATAVNPHIDSNSIALYASAQQMFTYSLANQGILSGTISVIESLTVRHIESATSGRRISYHSYASSTSYDFISSTDTQAPATRRHVLPPYSYGPMRGRTETPGR